MRTEDALAAKPEIWEYVRLFVVKHMMHLDASGRFTHVAHGW